MPIFLYLTLTCVGVVLGTYLTAGVLLAITLVVSLIVFWMYHANEELASILTVLAAICGAIVVATMWATYALTTDYDGIVHFFHQYVIRA